MLLQVNISPSDRLKQMGEVCVWCPYTIPCLICFHSELMSCLHCMASSPLQIPPLPCCMASPCPAAKSLLQTPLLHFRPKHFSSGCRIINKGGELPMANLQLSGSSPLLCSKENGTSYSFILMNQIAIEKISVSDNQTLVFVPHHPLIKHWISILRNKETPSPVFKNAMAELGRLLIYEAARDWLPTVTGEVETPLGVASVEYVDSREPVVIIPILRAGLALAEYASSILPATKTYHLGLCRDEETLQPTVYLNKLPDKLPEGSRVLIVDPMLATGNTMVAAIDLLKDRGVANGQIKLVSVLAANPPLQKLSEKFPGIHVYTGAIDPILTGKGMLVPGLGDAGDRSFGTTNEALKKHSAT